MRSCLRAGAFFDFSKSRLSQTNRPACRVRDLSVQTLALIDRHECHQGAQPSMNTGSLRCLESASARPKSSSMNGTAGFQGEGLVVAGLLAAGFFAVLEGAGAAAAWDGA